MAESRVLITNPTGLHARPAARFVELAASFKSNIRVTNLTANSPTVNAKSILGILSIGAEDGHEILISAEGEDADPACQALVELVAEELPLIDVPGK
jgi:phosphocarrier protein HPr